ncbi:hypothetical protein SD457_03315 [Coprobacillaceae bacterium CR2/5/TPMF4]|nr:hypothetical protein SD457_03315 [Coprobacillaceae bacterium CR2/5/TPMF4]
MTIYENIAAPLSLQKNKTPDMKKKVEDMAKLLNISKLLDKFPDECSGGKNKELQSAEHWLLILS